MNFTRKGPYHQVSGEYTITACKVMGQWVFCGFYKANALVYATESKKVKASLADHLRGLEGDSGAIELS